MLHKVLILFEASYNYIFWTLYLPNDFVSKRVLVIFNPSFLIFNKSLPNDFVSKRVLVIFNPSFLIFNKSH